MMALLARERDETFRGARQRLDVGAGQALTEQAARARENVVRLDDARRAGGA